MALALSTTLRNTRMDAITTAIDTGGAGTLTIYDGARPATGGTATTILAEIGFNATSFGAAASGVITANNFTADTVANNTGTATWFRVTDGASAFIMDGDVGTSGSDLNLNSTSISAGVTVDVTDMVLTGGNA